MQYPWLFGLDTCVQEGKGVQSAKIEPVWSWTLSSAKKAQHENTGCVCLRTFCVCCCRYSATGTSLQDRNLQLLFQSFD